MDYKQYVHYLVGDIVAVFVFPSQPDIMKCTNKNLWLLFTISLEFNQISFIFELSFTNSDYCTNYSNNVYK